MVTAMERKIVSHLLPGFIAPKSSHPFNTILRNTRRVFPNGISIHVHDGKVEEHINRLRLPGQLHDLPVKMQPVRIEQAQCTIEFPKMNLRQHLLRKLDVRVTGKDDNIAPVPAKRFEVSGSAGVHVYKIKPIKWWRHL
jgi:hypothetical protein